MLVVNKEVKTLPGSRVSLSITVSQKAIKDRYDKVLREYATKVKMDGFRPGKVPLDIIEKRYKSSLESQTLESVINQAFQEALEQTSQKPLRYQSPEIAGLEDYHKGKDLTFKATYDVFPQLEIKGYEGLQITVPFVSLGEEDIEQELKKIQDRYATLVEKPQEGVCEIGDVLLVDFCELDDKCEEVTNSKRQDFTFTLGKSENPYDFDREVEGMKKGQSRVFDKILPAGEAKTNLASKTVKLKVTLKRIQKKEIPVLNDELAKDINEKFGSLEDLKTAVRKEMQTQLDTHLRDYSVKCILDSLVEKHAFEVPNSLIEWQLDKQWKYMLQQSGMDKNGFEEVLGQTKERIRESWKPSVIENLKRQIVMENLLDKLNLEILEEDLDQEYLRQAENYGMPVEGVRQYFSSPQLKDRLKYDLQLEKLKTHLLDMVKVDKVGEQDYLTFMKNLV